jgi:hypothetical protein
MSKDIRIDLVHLLSHSHFPMANQLYIFENGAHPSHPDQLSVYQGIQKLPYVLSFFGINGELIIFI